ncbi:MAG: hypothetical protein K6C94_05105 [Candidatus Gastranaerophilales bacterium]|nr:hypothetical protein [Candidatus Gastranaerophilales bacterium]
MILGRIFSNIQTHKAEKAAQPQGAKELQKANHDLLEQSMAGLSSEALANTAKGSFQAMMNLQALNQQLQAQVNKQQQEKE